MIFENYIVHTFFLIALVSGVPLVVSSAAGLLVAALQTATQIQEQTISYLVKFLAVCLVFALMGNWFVSEILAFMQNVLESMQYLGRM